MKSKFVVLAFFLNGTLMVIMQIFNRFGKDSSVYSFVFIMFTVGLAMTLLFFLVGERSATRRGVIIGFGLGICALLAMILQLKSLKTVPGIVVFSVVNGGNPALAAILIHAIFREKLGIREFLGIGIGCSGIVLLSI